MFQAEIVAKRLGEVVKAISAITEEARIRTNAEGIFVKVADNANVCMVTLNLPKEAFSSFEATVHEFGVHIEKLKGIVAQAKKGELVRIELNDTNSKLAIQIGEKTYSMALLDPSSIRREPKVPELHLPITVEFLGEDFKKVIKLAKEASDYIVIGYNGSLSMLAEGDVDSINAELVHNANCIRDERSGRIAIKSKFSIGNLSEIAKVVGKKGTVTFDIGSDYPLKMRFKIAGGYGDVEYMIAPRVKLE